MKIPSATNQAPATASPARRFTNAAEAGADEGLGGLSFQDGENSFAGVLARVTGQQNSGEGRQGQDSSEHDAKDQEAAREDKPRRADDKDQDGAARLNAQAQPLRAVTFERALTTPNVRAILHISDLERVVAICRATGAEGGREVLLQLPNSIFEGLRVKISTDADGRVNAEFLTAREGVRAQLEARAGDLSALLRARGVKLAEVKTTLETSAQADTSGEGQPREKRERAAPTVNSASARAAGPEVAETNGPSATETANTYLA